MLHVCKYVIILHVMAVMSSVIVLGLHCMFGLVYVSLMKG